MKRMLMVFAVVMLAGCATVQDKADSYSKEIPYGSKILDMFRQSEGERAGMTRLPPDAKTLTEFVDNDGNALTNGVRRVVTIRYETPIVEAAIVPVALPQPGPAPAPTPNTGTPLDGI